MMREIELQRVSAEPEEYERVSGDAYLYENGALVGFTLESFEPRLTSLIAVADREFRSSRVPKLDMHRVTPVLAEDGTKTWERTAQYSAICGTLPPKPHLRRRFLTRSSLHRAASAKPFAKAMLASSKYLLSLLRQYAPSLHELHMDKMAASVPEEWRFGDGYTSTISNFNISAPIHQDNANVKGTCNAIVCKRNRATGGNLFLPEYGVQFDQPDGSLLFYPAWRNKHGVTEIEPLTPSGFRNSHIWYSIRVDAADDFDSADLPAEKVPAR